MSSLKDLLQSVWTVKTKLATMDALAKLREIAIQSIARVTDK
jgi:hypothetical protein